MPAYADQITLGEGKFRARLVVEGWPEIFVTDASLVRTTSDAREQILGLDAQSLRIAASADIARSEMKGSEQTIEVVDDSEVVGGNVVSSGLVGASLYATPSSRASLTADLSATATTMTVNDTSTFASSGVVHIGTEAIKYTGKTATSFTGLTRHHWNTKAQAHYTGDGERMSYPTVTDRPLTLRGRRVLVYLYGAADADTSAGTLRWRAIARTEAGYAQGRYSFGIEPMTWLFEQPIGGDIEEPVPLRGIYLPSSAGLLLGLQRRTGSGDSSSVSTADMVWLHLSGFWETQRDFCDALTTEIASVTSAWGWDADTELRAEPDGLTGWRLIYRVGSTNAYWLTVMLDTPVRGDASSGKSASPVDRLRPEHDGGYYPQWVSDGTSVLVTSVAAGRVYYLGFDAPVPRAVWSGTVSVRDSDSLNPHFRDPAGTMADGRLYLGGNVVPSTGMLAAVQSDPDADETEMALVDSVSTASRYVVAPTRVTLLLGPTSSVRLLRKLASFVNFGGLLTQIVADAPTLANTGAMPLVSTDDIDTVMQGITDAARGLRPAIRRWVASEGVALGEILVQEARLIGVYPSLDSSGKVIWFRHRPPLSTDVVALTLTATEIVGAWPTTSRSPSGNLKEVLYRQGWDPLKNEHTGTIRVRDVQGADNSTLGGVLEVAPMSIGPVGDYGLEIDPLDAEVLGLGVLRLFGGQYRSITIEVSMAQFASTIGDAVTITTPLIPDTDGTMGVSQLAARITGFDWSPFEGRGKLTLLASDLNIGGYCPSALVASQVNDSGAQWTLTLTLTGYTSETDAAKWYAVGDEVRVIQQGSVSPTTVSGTVDAVTTSTVQVTFDSTWTPGSSGWYLGSDTTANVDETAPSGRVWAQSEFAKIGGSDGKAALGSGDVQAQEFSP